MASQFSGYTWKLEISLPLTPATSAKGFIEGGGGGGGGGTCREWTHLVETVELLQIIWNLN